MPKFSSFLFALSFAFLSISTGTADDVFSPDQLDNQSFSALLKQSPFTRTLNLSGSLVITGIAKMENEEQVVTILDTSTKETYLISSTPNSQGWKMVEVKPSSDLERVTARISLGGEVVNIRYAETNLKPGETRPGGGSGPNPLYKKPDSSKKDDRGGSSNDFRERMSKLTPEQREKFFSKMRSMHEKKPGLSREDRMNEAKKMLEKMSEKDKR